MSSRKNRDVRMLAVASSVALNMSNYYPYRLGCVAVRKGCIIASGANSGIKTHPLQKRWNRERVLSEPEGKYLPELVHAEIDCMAHLRHMDGMEDVVLYVVRIKKNGTMGMARPCPACFGMMKDIGIRTVVYSTDEGYARETIIEHG